MIRIFKFNRMNRIFYGFKILAIEDAKETRIDM
jgi:hypothetical protein